MLGCNGIRFRGVVEAESHVKIAARCWIAPGDGWYARMTQSKRTRSSVERWESTCAWALRRARLTHCADGEVVTQAVHDLLNLLPVSLDVAAAVTD